MVFFDFIEIGTSNFDTEIQKATHDIRGLSVEPIKRYLDDLPNKKNCIKANYAVSDYTGYINIHYVSKENIKKYGLPYWAIGCNSVNKHHPTINKLLIDKKLNPDQIFTIDKVKVVQFSDLVKQYDITGIYYLKIDTEGHDITILNNYIDCVKDNPYLLAHKIVFESNQLSNQREVTEIINKLRNFGYVLKFREWDTLLVLNINKGMNETNLFTDKIDNYYLTDYPHNFNPNKLPYKNNLESAKEWCVANNCGGVTFQDNRYEVRQGKRLINFKLSGLKSWIRL